MVISQSDQIGNGHLAGEAEVGSLCSPAKAAAQLDAAPWFAPVVNGVNLERNLATLPSGCQTTGPVILAVRRGVPACVAAGLLTRFFVAPTADRRSGRAVPWLR